MAGKHSFHLAREPLLPWQGEHPYHRLEVRLRELGIERRLSDASVRQIHDVYFDLMQGAPDTKDRLAWDRLRRLRERLLVDFLMIEVPGFDVTRLDSQAAIPMPIHRPDFRELARRAIEVGPKLSTGVPSSSELARVARARVAATVGDLAPGWRRFAEASDG